MTTYIVTGGKVDIEWARSFLQLESADTVIAADKGLEACLSLGIRPDYIIGDFDSVSTEAKSFLASFEGEVVTLNPVKDDTDTEAALNLAFEKTQGDIVILGATGTRIDHMIANVYLLGQGFSHGRKVVLLDAYNRMQMTQDTIELAKAEQFGDYVSVLPIGGEAKGVTLEGFYYNLGNATMTTYSSLGVSNEIVEETARISVAQGTLLVVESRDVQR